MNEVIKQDIKIETNKNKTKYLIKQRISDGKAYQEVLEPENIEGVITRALDIFSCSSVEEGRRISDISVEIYNKNTSLIDMDDFDKTIDNGYNAIMNNKDKILQTFKEK